MDELRLAASAGAKLETCATSLKRLRVAARRDLSIGLLARQPHLEVVRFGRSKTHVAGAQEHAPERKLQAFQHFLGIRAERLQLVVRLLGRRQLHQFDLVELMLTDQATDVLSVRPRLAAKTRRVRRVTDGQIAAVENFAAMQVCQWYLCGRNQIQIPFARDLEQVGFELRKVASPDE